MITLPARLRDRRPLVGTLVTLAGPEVAEALAINGVGWLFVDLEHSPALDPAGAQRIVQAVAGRCYTVVRVPSNDETWIKQVLDTGADGVIVPHVGSAAEATRAVRAAKYPPLGARSVGIARANGYGADFAGYVARANADTALVVQIEDADAVREVDEIVAVPGVDAVLVGPYDLSGSMGRLGQVDHPEVRAAIDHVVARCRAADLPVGIFAGTVETARADLDRGVDFIAVGTDIGFLTGAARSAMTALTG